MDGLILLYTLYFLSTVEQASSQNTHITMDGCIALDSNYMCIRIYKRGLLYSAKTSPLTNQPVNRD